MQRRFLALLLLCPMLASPWAFAQHVEHIHADELGELIDERIEAGVHAAFASLELPTSTHTIERETVETVEFVDRVPVAVETLSFAYGYRDDGGCADPGHTFAGEVTGKYVAYDVDVGAHIRVAPSGGDCREDSVSYDIGIRKELGAIGKWDAVASFGASKQSTSAPYAIVDAEGNVLLRPDGQASDPVVLPAGAAETVSAGLSLCRDVGAAVNLCGGFNVVPVDWADGTSGRTVHVAASVALPTRPFPGWMRPDAFALDIDAHVGDDAFGGAVLRWARDRLSVSVRRDFGLNATDNGAPPTQTFSGLPAVATGAPKPSATFVDVGLRLR